MKLNQKTTVLEACKVLQSNILSKGNLLTDFIDEHYGDTKYLVTYEDTVYLEYSKIKLYDEDTKDKISIIKRNKHKETEEIFAIYHSSPLNNAKASYNFSLNNNGKEIIYHGIDVLTEKETAYIIKTDFIASHTKIKEKNITEFKVQGEEIEQQAKLGISNLNHYIKNTNLKILSKKKEKHC